MDAFVLAVSIGIGAAFVVAVQSLRSERSDTPTERRLVFPSPREGLGAARQRDGGR